MKNTDSGWPVPVKLRRVYKIQNGKIGKLKKLEKFYSIELRESLNR
jgi:hypothetical protein